MHRSRSLLLVAALLSVVLPLAGPGVASPQPKPVVPIGGDTLVADYPRPADDPRYPVTSSEAVLRVRPDGSGQWTVRAELANESDAATFREHPDRLARTVEPPVRHYEPIAHLGPDSAVSNVSSSIDDRTVTVTYDVSNAAVRSPLGPLVVTYFDTAGDRFYTLPVNRTVVVGPADTAVTNHPHAGTVDGRRLVLSGSDGYWSSSVSGLELVYGDSDNDIGGNAATPIRTNAALLLVDGPTILDNLVTLAVPTALLALVLGAFAMTSGRLRQARPRVLSLGIGGIGGLGVAASFATGPTVVGRDPLLLGGLLYLCAAGALTLAGRLERRPSLRAVGGLVLVGPVVWLLGFLLFAAGLTSLGSLLRALGALGFVLLPLPAFGFVVSRGDRRASVGVAAGALGALFLVSLGSVDVTEPIGGVFWPIVAAFAVVGLVVAWYPLFVVGHRFGALDDGNPSL